MKYFSMFSGIGGFELGLQKVGIESQNSTNTESGTPQHSISPLCVGYSEIDKYAIKVYERHFKHETDEQYAEKQECKNCGWNTRYLNKEQYCEDCWHRNYGDATAINPTDLPDFDLLVGGFPCQAFSIAGKRAGFNDTRGTLFFDIARILKEKQPRHLVLENVKGLLSHDSGRTFQTIIGVLTDLGYLVEWQVLNSKDFGVPQNRERVYIVGHLREECSREVFPITNHSSKNLKQLVGGSQGNRVYDASGISSTLASQAGGLGAKTGLYAIPVLTPDRHGLYDGARIRRLTPKECERLQGFPDNWTEGESDTQRYKMCGNAVTVNVVEAVMKSLMRHSNIN